MYLSFQPQVQRQIHRITVIERYARKYWWKRSLMVGVVWSLLTLTCGTTCHLTRHYCYRVDNSWAWPLYYRLISQLTITYNSLKLLQYLWFGKCCNWLWLWLLLSPLIHYPTGPSHRKVPHTIDNEPSCITCFDRVPSIFLSSQYKFLVSPEGAVRFLLSCTVYWLYL